jgi:hypothetical protein
MDVNSSHEFPVTVIGQEGDQAEVEVREAETCDELLRRGLKALYGEPAPKPDDFDLVLAGKVIEPLSQTVHDAGIKPGDSIAILPKSISRGAGQCPQTLN